MKITEIKKCKPSASVAELLNAEEYVTLLHPPSSTGRPGLLVLAEDGAETEVSWLFDKEVLAGQIEHYTFSRSYVSLNRFCRKRTNQNLVALNALYVDLDYHRLTRLKGQAPEDVRDEYADQLEQAGVPLPSLTVFSGRGLYAIWLIKELPAAARSRWGAAQKGIVELSEAFGADRACVDEARVFRVPGTINEKSGQAVRVCGGTLQRYCFEALSDSIYAALGRPSRRELQNRELKKRSTSEQKASSMPRGLTQKQRHKLILEDLEMYRQFCGGEIPEGYRNVFLHIYATCLTHTAGLDVIEKQIEHMAALAAPALTEAEVRAIKKQALEKAAMPVTFHVSRDKRYTYRGATIAEKLGISGQIAGKLGLKQVLPEEMRRERKAKAQQKRRLANGAVTRAEYLAANNASRARPWERYNLSRSQYYARKRAGSLPPMDPEGEPDRSVPASGGKPLQGNLRERSGPPPIRRSWSLRGKRPSKKWRGRTTPAPHRRARLVRRESGLQVMLPSAFVSLASLL